MQPNAHERFGDAECKHRNETPCQHLEHRTINNRLGTPIPAWLFGAWTRVSLVGRRDRHMNPRTRGFKVHGIGLTVWDAATQEPMLSTTTRSAEHVLLRNGFTGFTNTWIETGLFTSMHPPLWLRPWLNFLVKKHGQSRSTTKEKFGTLVTWKSTISVKPWGRSPSPWGSWRSVD